MSVRFKPVKATVLRPQGRMRERVRAGLARVRASGQRLGRPVEAVPREKLAAVEGLSMRDAARQLGVSRSTVQRWREMVEAGLSRKSPATRR